MVAGAHGFGKLTHARDMGPQKIPRLPKTGTRIVDVETSWQCRGVELPVDGLDQLRKVVAVFTGHQFRSQQTDQVEWRKGSNPGVSLTAAFLFVGPSRPFN